MSNEVKWLVVSVVELRISVQCQCELLGLVWLIYYFKFQLVSVENLLYMSFIDKQYIKRLFYGVLCMIVYLNRLGYVVNKKCIVWLMRLMDIRVVQLCKYRFLFEDGQGYKIYFYLLWDMFVVCNNQVWLIDIIYVLMQGGFLYLMVVIDWYSCFVLSWELFNSLECYFCLVGMCRVLDNYLKLEIFNID